MHTVRNMLNRITESVLKMHEFVNLAKMTSNVFKHHYWTNKVKSIATTFTLKSLKNRERTIIGSVSYRNRYWVYRIESYRLLLYRPILHASLQVQQLLTGCITHDDQRAFKRPTGHPPAAHARVRAVLWSMIRERVGGEGGGRRL